MAYRLDPGEAVSSGAKRIVAELIDRAVDHLTDSEGESHKGIHEARKRFKEVRAVLKLLRSEMDAYFPFENVFFRDAGRALAEARDAQAMLETVDKLVTRYGGEIDVSDPAAIRTVLSNRLGQQESKPPIERIVASLGEVRDRIEIWPLERRSFAAMEKGLRKTYGDGRRGFKRAYDDPAPENFHEWRKRVKDHWYHSQILQDLWPAVMKGYIGTLKELSQLLGDDHDLVVLRGILLADTESFGGDDAVFRMLQLIDRRRSELECQARVIGARVYAERPDEWIERMRGYWKAVKDSSSGQ